MEKKITYNDISKSHISRIQRIVEKNGGRMEVDSLYLNNSDNNEGEDVMISAITSNGLEMCDGDFYPWSDLSNEELLFILTELYI